MRLASTGAAVLLLLATACKERDLGTGLNTQEREYAVSAEKSFKASLDGVKDAGLRVDRERHDSLGGEIEATRADGSDVKVTVKAIDKDRSRVTIRVGPGDAQLATLLHEKIAGELGMAEAKSGLFGGDSMEGKYTATLGACVDAAHRAIRTLNLTLVREDVHVNSAQIDARKSDSVPIRLSFKMADQDKDNEIDAKFIVGNDSSEDNKAYVRRLKDEFERALHRAGVRE